MLFWYLTGTLKESRLWIRLRLAYVPAQITAFLAANVAYELLGLIAARRREEPAHGVGREPSVRH